MHEKFLKPYKPQEVEKSIYELWEKSGFFNPDTCIKKGVTQADAEPFSIVLPPPNVTGILHIGHAAMLAIEDILTRYNRMCGKKTLWLPGTDHAAIATQSKVEAALYKKEKKTRHDIGRKEFLKHVEVFAAESHATIISQIKAMGSSVDWSREAFTLDETRSRAVFEAFARMYDMGLIYRGARIVNWDPKMQTTVSDEEIEWKERQTPFYYLTYGPFTIGTARPETKFGDKYVVMHPNDSRYKKYAHGQKIDLEWINGPITATIIKDDAVDMEFGTGVMTITPWHDATDFDIAKRHELDKEQIIDEKGKLLPLAGEFSGMHIKKARPLIVEKLQEKGLIKDIDENYTNRIAHNSRGDGIIEPQIKSQWFVAVDKTFVLKHSNIKGIESGANTTLKELMKISVTSGAITIIPEHFEKTYHHWIDNLHDWCISRQIWYGHRIPVWYHENKCVPIPGREDEVSECETMVISEKEPKCTHCNALYEQDPDTLDTWFSSGLWTFSTLGWPDATADFKTYHPTSVLETGYDILFFWIVRMILMSGCLLGTIPFRRVYLHGLVRDKDGHKMSKSLGNTIDPVDMAQKYGADATRLSLIVGVAPGNDLSLSEERIRGYKHFANKLWNITRFVLTHVEETKLFEKPDTLRAEDRQWLDKLGATAEETTRHIEDYRFDLAADGLYQWVWHEFADKYLEEVKSIFENGSEEDKVSAKWTLYTLLTTCLTLLHPFVPFVTEEIWQALPHKNADLLMVAQWPKMRSG